MFSPQARWDRKLPGDGGRDDEAVEVAVLFRKGRIIPVYFILNGNRFNVLRVNYSWTERKGSGRLFYFSVSDKSDNYCLFLDDQAMAWRLKAQ